MDRAGRLYVLACASGLAAGIAASAVACGEGPSGRDDPDARPDAGSEVDAWAPVAACDPSDEDPRGPACLQKVATDPDFDLVSLAPTGVQYWERATKYMVPARDDPSLVPALVQNANRYPIHLEFLKAVFLPGLDLATYMQMVTVRATRQYYTGNLVRIDDPLQGRFYGFTVYTAGKASEILEPVEVRRIYDTLSSIVTAGPLAFTFEPFDAMGPAKAKAWIDPGFPVYYPAQDAVKVEVYTPGIAYGRVHLYTLDAFDAAAASGLPGYRDIAVIDQVPFDIEGVLAAVVTGGRQWELSHVNVRMARRGTPNLFVDDPLDAFAPWDGQLVRLEAAKGSGGAAADNCVVAAAGEAEAEAWWASHRPRIEDVPAPDRSYANLDTLREMDVDDQPVRLVTRFGGKATNLARLYAFLEAGYQVPGFGIPFAPFEAFLDATTMTDDRHVPPDVVTLREYVRRLEADPEVAAEPLLRQALLAGLRARIQATGTVPRDLLDALVARIRDVFGGTGVRVRFRSSSNVEDGLEFSGAGLYDSTTVCADDSIDGDASGPSRCDAGDAGERTVERGLREVWASLYNDRAWDERDWYQVPQEAASMAILVTLGFPDEAANGVVFTGDPSDPDETRYLVNAQVGDEKVVGNDPSKVPEKDLLEMTDGVVTHVYRVRSSTLAAPGVPVLTDAQLQELGALMASIDARFPIELQGHDRADVLLDVEFKIQKGTGQLKIKQIRPFLRNVPQEVAR